jgi:hypothetical protein
MLAVSARRHFRFLAENTAIHRLARFSMINVEHEQTLTVGWLRTAGHDKMSG